MKPLLAGYNFYLCNNLPKSPFSSARQSGLSLESVGGNCEKRLKRKRLIVVIIIIIIIIIIILKHYSVNIPSRDPSSPVPLKRQKLGYIRFLFPVVLLA